MSPGISPALIAYHPTFQIVFPLPVRGMTMNSRSHPDGAYGAEHEEVNTLLYRAGVRKPNYPMPAIPHHVTIQPDYVAVYDKHMVSFSCWHKPKDKFYWDYFPSYWD